MYIGKNIKLWFDPEGSYVPHNHSELKCWEKDCLINDGRKKTNKKKNDAQLLTSPHTGSSSQPLSNGSPLAPTPNAPWFYCLAWCHILWSISLVILGQLSWMGCFQLLLYTQLTHFQGSIRRYSTAKTSVLSTLFSF